MKVSTRLAQVLLYAPGTFFGFPWKPIACYFVGDGYDVAYQHFRRDHHGLVNLSCHFMCLWLQVLSNFALIDQVDMYLHTGSLLRIITVALWILFLLPAPAPGFCTFLSIMSLIAGFIISPMITAH